MKLPVVGYGGHRKGFNSENYFAKDFRQTQMIVESNMRRK